MKKLDPRLHAWRPDLADQTLQGEVAAQRFVTGEDAFIGSPVASIHILPATNAAQTTQALFGEACRVFERHDRWAWIQLKQDGYVGYVQEQHLRLSMPPATHRVCNISTWWFSGADLKSQPASELYMGSRVCVARQYASYAALDPSGSVFAGHVTKLDGFERDFVAVAERFVQVPYYWGGKTSCGIDCSGLVQVSLQACGVQVPRDSDLQEQALGELVHDHTDLRRGDLVFWKGHVGMMFDRTQILHANGHQMHVSLEPMNEVIARSEHAPSSIKRME